jgi:hypothetical protein
MDDRRSFLKRFWLGVAIIPNNRPDDLLTQNFKAYMSAPVHYRSLQLAALNNFDTLWNAFQQAGRSSRGLQ